MIVCIYIGWIITWLFAGGQIAIILYSLNYILLLNEKIDTIAIKNKYMEGLKTQLINNMKAHYKQFDINNKDEYVIQLGDDIIISEYKSAEYDEYLYVHMPSLLSKELKIQMDTAVHMYLEELMIEIIHLACRDIEFHHIYEVQQDNQTDKVVAEIVQKRVEKLLMNEFKVSIM